MLIFQHMLSGLIVVRDQKTNEELYWFQIEDFLLWMELMDLEGQGYIGIYAKRTPYNRQEDGISPPQG